MVERCPDKTEAVGPIPSTPTWKEEKKKEITEFGGNRHWKYLVKFPRGLSVPIILALIAGKMLDERYGTKPWYAYRLCRYKFLISSFGIVRAC